LRVRTTSALSRTSMLCTSGYSANKAARRRAGQREDEHADVFGGDR
jgi:hypothetical protein